VLKLDNILAGLFLIFLCSYSSAAELIKVPLRISYVESSSYQKLDVEKKHQHISQILGTVNDIWRQAKIEFYLDKQKTIVVAISKSTKKEKITQLRKICPESKRGSYGIDLCVVGNIFHPAFGGVAFSPKKRSPLVIWPFGVLSLYKPNPATLAHEIGHALGLKHNEEDDIYLMRGAGNNIRRIGRYGEILLLPREILTARKYAVKFSKN